MEQNKYYTPEIEDLRVGYEYEFRYDEKHTWQKETIDICPQLDHEQFDWVYGLLEKNNLRVPYLTKEQIVDEGWELTTIGAHFKCGFVYSKISEDVEYRLNFEHCGYKKNLITVIKVVNKDTLVSIFQGDCKSINELRIVEKLLNI